MPKHCKIISWFIWEPLWLIRQVFQKHFRLRFAKELRHLQPPVNTKWVFLKYCFGTWLVQPLLWNPLGLGFWFVSGHPCKYGTVVNLILNQISHILYQVLFRNYCLWHFWFKLLTSTGVVVTINLFVLLPFMVKKASKLLQFLSSRTGSLGCWWEHHINWPFNPSYRQ